MTKDSILLGHRLVTGILVFLMLMALLTFLLPLTVHSVSIVDVLRLGITAGLCWLVYQGRLWARLLLIFLCLVASIAPVLSAFAAGLASPFGLLFLVIGLGYFASSVTLFAARPVRDYFAYVSDEALV